MEDELKDAIRENMRQRFKQQLQDLEATQNTTKMRRIVPRPWLIAAGIALALAVAGWLWLNPSRIDHATLADSLFEPLPNVLAPELRGEDNSSLIITAMQQYDKGAYAEAANQLSTLPDSLQTPETDLYLATAYLAQRRSSEALTILDGLGNQTEVQWYRCLALLLSGEEERAKSIALELASTAEGYYQERAAALLDAIQ